MKLIIKNKLISMGGASKVTDSNGKLVYIVKGSVGSNILSKKYKKTIIDVNGNKIFKVCNQRIHGPLKHACFIYDKDNNEVAHVMENGGFKSGYLIEGTTDKLEIVRKDIYTLEILQSNKKIGSIGPEVKENGNTKINLTDTFCVEFSNPSDASFMVAIVIAIDNISDSYKK